MSRKDRIEEFISLRGLEVDMNYPNCYGLYQPIWKWAPTSLNKGYNKKVEKYNNRINLILSEVDNPKGTFIDIGCSEGYDTFEIFHNGGDVVGVDNVDRVIPTAEFLRLHYKFDGVKIIQSDIQGYFDSTEEEYDYCLCLLVLHHYLDKYENLSDSDDFFKIEGINLLHTIKERCNISFLQLRFQEDKELNGRPHKPFVDYLTNKIGFSKVKPLSVQDDYKGKPSIIYKCTK